MEKLSLERGKTRRKISRRRLSDAIWGYVCVAPLCIGLLMFLAAPLFFSFYVSLTNYDLFNAPVFVGFKWYAQIFSADGFEFWNALKNAFIMCLGVLISMTLALLTANVLCGNVKGGNVFKAIFFVPTICSSVATTIMWKRMYDYYYGTINQIITAMGFERVYWLDEDHVVFSLIFMGVLFGFGTAMLLYISSIKSIPRSHYEAAELDGANSVQKFFYITLPSVSPITFYILVTGLIGCLQGFTQYQIMTNGNPSNTMMPVLLIFKYSGNDYGAFYGLASAMAIVLGLIIALLTGINFLVSRKWVYYES